jgi:drug/metabolite transporter (DMT)-like permease
MIDGVSTFVDRANSQDESRSSSIAPEKLGVGLGLLAALIGASQTVMGAKALAAGLNAVDMAFLRYAVAGLLMAPLFMARGGWRTAGGLGWRKASALAVVGGPAFTLLVFGGLSFAPFSHGAILPAGAMAVGGVVLAAVLLGDKIDVARKLGVGVVLAGLLLIGGLAFVTSLSAQALLGDAMFIAAGLLWAAFLTLLRRWSIPPLQATAALAVIVASAYVPLYAGLIGFDRLAAAPPSIVLEAGILQGVLVGILATVVFAKAAQLLGPGKAAAFPALVPGFAVLLAMPVLGQVPNTIALLGLAVVGVGQAIMLGVVKLPQREKEQPAQMIWPADLRYCGA